MAEIGTLWDDRYHLTRELDVGGFGRVFHAVRMKDSADVAIKVLERDKIGDIGRFISVVP